MNKMKHRLAIFFFYDKDGIVDDYVDYLVKNIREQVDELLVVCNGQLNDEGHKTFFKYTSHLIVRENIGFDVWAYKEGLAYYGWDQLSTFDEIIMLNFTIMGPIYPFEEMFETMDQKDLDFWGCTKHHMIPFDPFGRLAGGIVPEHIQSHFIAVRQSMLKSEAFQKYWEEMPMIKDYFDAICCHEAIFTKTFEEKGFKWDVYVDTDDLREYTYYPLQMVPRELVENRKCPIIKRRGFFHKFSDYLDYTAGEPVYELMDYITHYTDYDENLIWQNILRTMHQVDFKRAMQLNYVLSTTQNPEMTEVLNKKKIAAVFHLYFEDLIDKMYQYLLSVPEETDIYITTDTIQKKEAIEEKFKKFPCHKVEVIQIENRGRDVSALLVGAKDFIMDYDYVCFAHDKKVTQITPYSVGGAFAYKCMENLFKSKAYVLNIIDTFEKNPRLGMLMPSPPNNGAYYPTLGNAWMCNYEITKKLYDRLKLTVPIDEHKEPISPLGTMFWFRPEALKTLFDCDWEYSDFPEEPNKTDGTLLHAIERIYGLVVQNDGFYPAWVYCDTFAQIELTNLNYMLSEINEIVFDKFAPSTFDGVKNNLNRGLKKSFKHAVMKRVKDLLRKLPNSLYFPLVRFKKKYFK